MGLNPASKWKREEKKEVLFVLPQRGKAAENQTFPTANTSVLSRIIMLQRVPLSLLNALVWQAFVGGAGTGVGRGGKNNLLWQ